MAALLNKIYSIINGKTDAKDSERAFTFIEFIKEFGYDNSTSTFLDKYKDYLSLWSSKKSESLVKSDEEFVRQNLIDTLKSIVLTYSSYEEQDFIANIDWENPDHQRAIVPFFAEKIKNICDFYKNKRQEANFVVNKNNFKGSKASLEQIIYDKIIDFYFENKNLVPQIAELQNNLSISIEQYVDIYCDYFDISRKKLPSDATRARFITANVNTARYKDYVEVSKTITDLLYSGEVYLEEIPLIAQVGLDLSQQCAGDASTLRDVLLENATLNLVSLNDQIALRRRLYQKYLGCDLYYIYCEDQDHIYIDTLTKADNPSGNLLNCGTSDSAVVEANDYKLLSQIGLFFKPDKTGILKISADDYVWEVDKSKLKDDTFYIFPDPNKCGDIGNNKDINYPLIFEYKVSSYVKNISSGVAKNEPLAYLSSTTLNTYATTQDRDFILNKNKNYNYSFTSLANQGIISNYQVDIFGNEFALFKDYYEDEDGIHVSSKFKLPEVQFEGGENFSGPILSNDKNVLINGGYYVDPYSYIMDGGQKLKFDDKKQLRITDKYYWSGSNLKCNSFTTPDHLITSLYNAKVDLGGFVQKRSVKYEDHFGDLPKTLANSNKVKPNFLSSLILNRFITKLATLKNKKIIIDDKSYADIQNESGILWFKETNKVPRILSFNNTENDKINGTVIDYSVIEDIIIVKVKEGDTIRMVLLKEEFSNKINISEIETFVVGEHETVKLLYNETENKAYFAVLKQNPTAAKMYDSLTLTIHQFDIASKQMRYNFVSSESLNLGENFRYVTEHEKLKDFAFSYNNELDIYLLTYLFSTNSIPYIYEHSFKMYNDERFMLSLKSEVYYNMETGSKQLINIHENDLQTSNFFTLNG